MSERGGRYFPPEKMQKIADLIEAGKDTEALAIVTTGGRGGKWKTVDMNPEEFLSAESNGTIRIVLRGPKATVCLERPAKDYADKKRKYVYQDLEAVL